MKLRISYQPGTCHLRLDNKYQSLPIFVSWFAQLINGNSDLDLLVLLQKLDHAA
jgi:hypothetical protein